ncbi:MAG: AMP-binding protein [Acidobacteriaceae bacterium]
MSSAAQGNFAARLVERLGPCSCFIDAAAGTTIESEALPHSIAACGTSLLFAGLQRGDRLLIGCALSPASSLVYLGAMYAGLVAVPVDERTLTASAAELVAATGARAVWTETAQHGDAFAHAPVLRLHGDLAANVEHPVHPADCSPADSAALMGTSGSTGVPRFVMVTHGNLLANTEAIIRSMQIGHDERAMLILPVSYCFGASLVHTHLYQGGSVVFDRRFMFPDKVLQAVVQFDCTTFAGVPTVYNVLLRRSGIHRIQFPALRRFLQAGGGLAREKVDEMREAFPHVRFFVMYGQTEATARISCMDPDRWHDKPGSVGLPLDNLTVSIVDEAGKPVPLGQTGELLVTGPSICVGYCNDPEESKRKFQDGWLRTGDMAHQDEDGFLWIDGRAGAFLKIRGTRVSFAEVEAKVAAIPGIYECGASAAEHPEAGEALVLWVVADQGHQPAAAFIRHHLPAHWTLDSVHFVPDLPKTSSGKISRAALAEMSKEMHASAR